MYHPYIALVWEPRSAVDSERACDLIGNLQSHQSSLVCRFLGSGAVSLDSPRPRQLALAYVLANGYGVIYGRLFRRCSASLVSPDTVAADDAFARSCVDTNGDYLTKHFWGAYVAILVDPHSTRRTVIRDCSGQMPCYYTDIGGILAICSDIKHLEHVLPPPSINWKYLTAFLSSPHLEIRETGLLGISELLAGEALCFSHGRIATRFAWNPTAVCARDPILDKTQACKALQEAACMSVSAWARSFHKILHSLSGGFDSSLVLQLLAKSDARPEVICINRYSDGPSEDERSYARAAARACHVDLLEIPMDVGMPRFDQRCLEIPKTAKPSVLHLIGAADAAGWNDICSKHLAETVWTGQGGDHIFMAATRFVGLIDCLRLYGFSPQLSQALRDAVVLTRKSLWHVLAGEALFAFGNRRFLDVATIPPQITHLCKQAIPDSLHEYTLHPWYLASKDLPAGKRYQLLILCDVLNRHRPMPEIRTTEEFHPLLSQPLIETCLRIPLSLLLADGRPRGLARRAFANYLPETIARREQKGEAGSYILGLFRRSSQFISELLLDGLLVREGLLSRTAINRLLEPDFAITTDQFDPLFACTAAEVWARTWTH